MTEGQWAALQKATGTAEVFAALETALDVDLRREEERYRQRETIAAILRPWFAARDIGQVSAELDGARALWGRYRGMADVAAAHRRGAAPGAGRRRARPARPDRPGSASTAITARSPLRWNGGYGEPGQAPVLGRETEQVLTEVLGLTGAGAGAGCATEASSRPPGPNRRSVAVTRLAQTAGLTDVQQEILATVREFVDREIIPHAQALEHADEYPSDIVAGMREMGLFGLTIGEEYGGLGESLLTYALVVEQIARGWMSVSGILNTHFIVAYMIRQHGTAEQKAKFLPADGRRRGPRLVLHVRARPRLGRRRHQDQGGARRRRRLRRQRRQDVADQRRQLHPDRAAGPDGRGRGQTAPEPHRLPGREAGRLRRGAARPDHPRQDRQDGLQGRRYHRGAVRRLLRCRATACSAARPAAASPR